MDNSLPAARRDFKRHELEVLTGGGLMPTNDHLFYTAALAWLRAQVDRLRRSVMSRRPAVRWSLALLVVVGMTSMVYWAATSFTNLGVRYLVSGRRFSSDDLIKVCSALDKQRLKYRVDDSRRVEVAADQYDQAADIVAKLEIGQRPIGDIREQSYMSTFLDSPSDRENRKQLAREKIIEGLIGKLDGVVSSLVSINRPQSSKWLHANAKPTAFVYIETEGNRQLPYQTAQSIPFFLTGCVPDLTSGSITVMDRRGFRYYDSGNLAIGDASRNRAREEDLVKEIEDKLDWIKGVRVQVKVNAPTVAEPAPTPATTGSVAHQPVAPDPTAATTTGGGASKSDPGGSIPAMSVNQAVTLEPEPAPLPKLPASSASVAADGAGKNSSGGGHPGEREQQRKHEPGRVLIYVPRSFYLNADIRPDKGEPTRDELRLMAERTENQIHAAVGLVTPSSEAWKVDIFTIPDEVSLNRSVNLDSAVDARRRVLDWGIVGTVVAVVSILAAVGSWIQVARRPMPTPRPVLDGRRYHADSASEPGPSERVRELVRRDPEAAASVLQRWTGQGGRV
jgi:flagellar M-ring protein FliF